MRKIKFRVRGKAVSNGKLVYGDLLHYSNGEVRICPIDSDMSVEVDPDSIARFVGYDSDGNEVYEGDTVTDKYGHTLIANLSSWAASKDKHFRVDWHCDTFDF